jgi:glucans biosynthesis protein
MLELVVPFAGLRYDQFRAIRFREEEQLFADGGGFRMDLLPPGFYYGDRIEVNIVAGGEVLPLPFSTSYFDFHPDYFPWPDGRPPADLASGMSFSGIRFRHPINRPGVWDEVAVFQGASYFRAVAHDTFYGLSARGLAIGTGGSEPEEFPLFTAFWVHEPQPGDRVLRLAALLDSDSVAGAFEFTIEPGPETVMEVRSVLFPRVEIAAAGIAPLTSMYYFGPDRRTHVEDFRDAVHDSSGLRMVNGAGERIWRPLRNPGEVETSAFADTNPRAFGLLQRPRDFTHFRDAEAHYEQRPSAWVEPVGDWGPGAVMLVELPSTEEILDNIVAFWRPEAPLAAGSEHGFAYRLTWGQEPRQPFPLARIIDTRGGQAHLEERRPERQMVVDFDLGMINFATITPKLEASGGEVTGLGVSPLPGGNIARVGFHFLPGEHREIEFRLVLVSEDEVASEVWIYRWSA